MKGAASIGIPAHDYNRIIDYDININNYVNDATMTTSTSTTTTSTTT